MSDRFRPLSHERLAGWIAAELDGSGSVFGLPRELFFVPSPDDRFTLELRGARLETPVGVAAGPHTQLAPNIVVAWLCGARVIELKTVQTLDQISVPKPCIDMQDEGYNVEWSQELTVRESFAEYLGAWVLIHALHARLGFPGERPGVVFDLSVGYDLAGLRRPNMRWYLEHIADAGDELVRCRDAVARHFPEVRDLAIPARLADSVTLSTLHGCPPDEIGAIVEHLVEAWHLHTAVKLNPTLLGLDTVREILVGALGWDTVEPDPGAFEADIRYRDALELLQRLRALGERRGLEVGVKLCNTLPVVNRRPAFDDGEATAYLSGRPLHALAVELARRLADDAGDLAVSFAGGADAFNTPDLLAAGLRPVTSCSDLLRVGGYVRLGQYLSEIDNALDRAGAADLDELCLSRAGRRDDVAAAARLNLERYADSLRSDPSLCRNTFRRDHTKTARGLDHFDCIEAPCTDACGVRQRVPEYMRRVATGDLTGAVEVVAADNPLPSILGRACHHPCEPVCLRTHLDEPVAIREIKRFITEHAEQPVPTPPSPTGVRVAVVGAGPCGLAAASFLARAGVEVSVFETRGEGGGMVSATIPGYRAAPAAVHRDLAAVEALGVSLVTGVTVGRETTLDELLAGAFRHVVVAVGAQRGLPLGLENEDAAGVIDGLDFLRAVRRGTAPDLGRRVAVVGGGDVAMDCARSARRLGEPRVEVLYRRSRREMPAHPEEVRDLFSEGIAIRELVAPRRLVVEDGRLRAVECAEMVLGDADPSGRPRPLERPGPGTVIEVDTLIVAIGQRPDLTVFGDAGIALTQRGYVAVHHRTMATSRDRVWAGGDVVDPGPSNIVDACGDGRRIARAILEREGLDAADRVTVHPEAPHRAELLRRRSTRLPRVTTPRRAGPAHRDFVEVTETLTPADAAREASRCLDCDLLCSTCEGVCPNRAMVTYRLAPGRVHLRSITMSAAAGLADDDDGAAFEISQTLQVAVLADLCNECGNCVTFCPTAGRPWHDKPRVFFHRGDFETERDNAFMLLRIDGEPAIQARIGGKLHQVRDGKAVVYDLPGLHARLRRHDLEEIELVVRDGHPPGNEPDLRTCAAMIALLRGLTGSLPHLPVVDAEPGWVIGGE